MSLKTIPALLLLCITCNILTAQSKTYQIKADTVCIFSNCDTAELKLENRTRAVLNGVLTNKGNGVTEFRKVIVKINDSMYTAGGDTMVMPWLLNGNTVGTIKKLGTVDSVDLPVITNNMERMRISSNGAIGIGTSSPVAKLDIVTGVGDGTGNETNSIRLRSHAINGNAMTMQLGVSNVGVGHLNNGYGYIQSSYWGASDDNILWLNPRAGGVTIGQAGSNYWNLLVHDKMVAEAPVTAGNTLAGTVGFAIGSNYRGMPASIQGIFDKPQFYTGMGLVFNTISGADISSTATGIERMRITSDGDVGVGTTTPSEKFEVAGNIKTTGFILPTNAATGYVLVSDANGNASWQVAATPSDFNLKENITLSDFKPGKLLALTIKDFNYKADKNKTRYTGLIAQELKTVIPELVLGKEGGYSIDYVKMVPYLLKAIQEQENRIDEQQKEIIQLKQQPKVADNTATPYLIDMIQQLQKQVVRQQEEIKRLQENTKK